MKFVIRDDDVSYFTDPELIERCYGDIINSGIPVLFAVIPFIKKWRKEYPRDVSIEDKEYPVSDNKEIVSYLVSKGSLVDIALHGCTHETRGGVYEFSRKEGLFEEIKRGRIELEKTFNRKINVFVPPHDWLGRHGELAVETEGLNVVRGRGTGIRNFVLDIRHILVLFQIVFFRISNLVRGKNFAYPFVVDFCRHKELCSYRIEDKDVFEGLNFALEKDGVFVVVVHHQDFSEEKKQILLRLIDIARKGGAKFVKSESIFS